MVRRTTSRRRLLLTGSSTALALLAGCTGGSDGGGDGSNGDGSTGGNGSGGESTGDDGAGDDAGSADASDDGADDSGGSGDGGTRGTSDQFDESVPVDDAFVANPRVSGPGGDALYCPVIYLSDDGDVDEFDRLVILVQEIVLHRADGDAVTVPIDVRLDCTAYERASSSQGDVVTLGWELEIPAGEYTHMDFVAMADEIVHQTDGDVIDVVGLESAVLGTDPDEAIEVEADTVLRTLQNARITYDPGDESVVVEEASPGGFVGISSAPSRYNNHDFYEND